MERSAKSDTASALQQALVSARELKAALQRSEEPIAIIGAACRLPGADSLEAFWSLMAQQRDAIEEVPATRWSSARLYDPDPMVQGKLSTRWAGVIDECGFDAGFFGISDAEAAHMDAQQRVFLEVAWEALVHAGQTRERLRGSQTGVYVGVVNYNDGYARRLFSDIDRINAFSGPGVSNSVLAGRLSYLFDLKGPSLAIDTACSSSLVAVHQACQSLRSNECDQAIAGGVNLILSPDFSVATSRMGLMAADGRCKPFDERADGIVRSDGCGVIVLKRLSDATRDGDRVLAVIQASAVNQDGRTNGMTAPNGLAQEALLRRLLGRAGMSADSLGYVEAHGTGTKLGDPIEVSALANVLGARAGVPPCLIGSVKGNIGHCEAAAGIASLIKTVLCLQHRSVPGFADLRTLNRHIDGQTNALMFAQTTQPWPEVDGKPLFGLVSSFGWSGTNAQLIIGSGPTRQPVLSAPLLKLAAPTANALREAVTRACAALAEVPADTVVELAAPSSTGGFRKAFVAGTASTLASDMRRWLERDVEPSGPGEKLALVFSGQGSQWPGMVDQLLAQDAVFRRSLQQSETVIQRLGGWSLMQAIAARSECDLALTQWAQPSIVAIQLALFDMLVSWGIEPAAVTGHSIGELSAACCAGILDREQTLRAALLRGRCMAVLHGQGSMHALLAAPDVVRQILDGFGAASISAYNSPAASIVSVSTASLASFQQHCAKAGVEPVTVNAHYPFHCNQLETLQVELQEAFAHLQHRQGVLTFVSSSHSEGEDAIPRDASYWVRNALRPVRFDLAIERLAELGCDTFVELGPHASLVQHIQRCLGDAQPGLRTMAVLNRHKPLQQSLNELLAGLYEAGQTLDSELDTVSRHHVWQHSTFELPALDACSPRAGHTLAGDIVTNELQRLVFEARWCGTGLLADHCMFDRVVVPGAMHLSAIATQALGRMRMSGVHIRDMEFLRPLLMPHGQQRQVFIEWNRATEDVEYDVAVAVEVDGSRQSLSCGTVQALGSTRLDFSEQWPATGAGATDFDCDAFYDRAKACGLQLGPLFRRIDAMCLDEHAQLMQVRLLPCCDEARNEGLVVDPGVLDACFQALFAGYWWQCPEMDLYIPLAVGEMSLASAVHGVLHATIRLTTSRFDPHSQIIQGDIALRDEQGTMVASLRNVQLKRAERAALLNTERDRVIQACSFDWLEVALPETPEATLCHVLIGNDPLADLLATRLQQAGQEVATAARPGAPAVQWVYTLMGTPGEVTDWSSAIAQQLELMRGLCERIEAAGVDEARLSVVTLAAHDPQAGAQHLLAAATLAVLRVIATEFPAIRCQAIDLPAPWPSAEGDLDTLVSLLNQSSAANNLLRIERGLVFAQVAKSTPLETAGTLPVQPQGRYLITGGFADTGQAMLHGLIERGARCVTLMGRGRPPQPLVEQARRLNQQGLDVHLFQGDLANVADVEALMRHVARKGRPLMGVMHLAGVVEDGLLVRLDAQAVSRVLAPKVTGTVNLHQAVQGHPLQWFVVFSSLSACIGMAGQAAYAAANAFAQALMAQRNASGQVGHAIAWGPWSAGMTARLSAEHQQHLEAQGLGQMNLDEVVHWALSSVLGTQAITLVAKVSPIVLEKLLRLGGQAAVTLDEQPGAPVALHGSFEQLQAAMTRLVIEELAKATRGNAPTAETPLDELGLDSLGAVAIVQRIRQRTGKTLPITAFFDSHSLADVVTKLLAHG
jgi:acyl transferase domain-containing protein